MDVLDQRPPLNNAWGAALPNVLPHPVAASPASACNSVTLSRDGELLAAGHDDGSVRLWEVATGKELRRFAGHEKWVWSVAFSPDGQMLASGSEDRSVRLWEVATGRWLATLVLAAEGWVAFTPDGRYKLGGNPAGSFWFLSGLCRFEPGELDPFVPTIRGLASDEPLLGVR